MKLVKTSKLEEQKTTFISSFPISSNSQTDSISSSFVPRPWSFTPSCQHELPDSDMDTALFLYWLQISYGVFQSTKKTLRPSTRLLQVTNPDLSELCSSLPTCLCLLCNLEGERKRVRDNENDSAGSLSTRPTAAGGLSQDNVSSPEFHWSLQHG